MCFYHEMDVADQMTLIRYLTLVLKFCICSLHCVCLLRPVKTLSHIFHDMTVMGLSLSVHGGAPLQRRLGGHSVLSAVQGS